MRRLSLALHLWSRDDTSAKLPEAPESTSVFMLNHWPPQSPPRPPFPPLPY
jgi:hypothetical protein